MEKEIISNSSSLIFIAKLNIFHLAKKLFSKIIIPEAVLKEIFQKETPENEIIRNELNKFIFKSNVKSTKEMSLDEGERAAISLCLEKKINLFLSDDKKARNYASSLGIRVIGILGIIFYNFKEKIISKSEFMALLKSLIDSGYYISPALYSDIIEELNQS